jgi:hypothetical protein
LPYHFFGCCQKHGEASQVAWPATAGRCDSSLLDADSWQGACPGPQYRLNHPPNLSTEASNSSTGTRPASFTSSYRVTLCEYCPRYASPPAYPPFSTNSYSITSSTTHVLLLACEISPTSTVHCGYSLIDKTSSFSEHPGWVDIHKRRLIRTITERISLTFSISSRRPYIRSSTEGV